MKKSIIYLGIALVSLSNVCSASNNLLSKKIILDQDGQENFEFQYQNSLSFGNEVLFQRNFPVIADETNFNPASVIPMNIANTNEEIIAENNSITENNGIINQELFYIDKPIEEVILADNQLIESDIDNKIKPLYIEKTIEDFIDEDNSIIESNISSEVFILDFEKINQQSNALKQINNEKFVGMN